MWVIRVDQWKLDAQRLLTSQAQGCMGVPPMADARALQTGLAAHLWRKNADKQAVFEHLCDYTRVTPNQALIEPA